jgi:hypothetical protein
MITQQQAESIAQGLLGRQAADADQPWGLLDFDHGWLIREEPPAGEELIGEAHRVIERETGRVVLFPSSVPPGRIMNDYSAIQDRGLVENV